MLNSNFVKQLRCPIDGQPLSLSEDGNYLINESKTKRYEINNDIAMLLPEKAQEINA